MYERPLPTAATVVLSIDLPASLANGPPRFENLAERLRRLVEMRRLPVTWAVPQPGLADDVDVRFDGRADSEVAILGDATWVGDQRNRTRFAHELALRVKTAREAGFRISTLAVRDTVLSDHLDLLVKHRISMVRGPAHGQAARGDLQPHSLRFGVWYAGVSLVAPRVGGWPWRGPMGHARRAIRRAILVSGFLQIVVEADRLNTPRLFHQFDLLTAHLQRLRDRQAIRMRTLGTLAQRLAPRGDVACHSILRAA